jgi:hypothetical protein
MEILRREVGPGAPILQGVVRAHRVGGRDPVATFLAQVHRCDDLERIGRRTGRFQLVA